jgi:hypothetical protein
MTHFEEKRQPGIMAQLGRLRQEDHEFEVGQLRLSPISKINK